VWTGAPADPALVREYRDLVESWGVRPALATRLGDRLDQILDRANG
jgi:hypothetical protein